MVIHADMPDNSRGIVRFQQRAVLKIQDDEVLFFSVDHPLTECKSTVRANVARTMVIQIANRQKQTYFFPGTTQA